MKHPSLHEAELAIADCATPVMTPAQRRERWAEALETHNRRVRTFHAIEYTPRGRRDGLRADHSALSIAFADPVLRAAGLRNDTYGAGRAFFELSHGDMHRLLCGCHLGDSENARRTALRVRRLGESRFAPAGRLLARAVGALIARLA